MTVFLLGLLAQAPPVHPQDPPGWEKMTLLIDWITKGAIGLCMVALVVCGGSLGFQHVRGTVTPESHGKLIAAALGAVLIGTSSAIVNRLV